MLWNPSIACVGVGGELEQAIDCNVACYENYCIRKERKKCTDVFKVTPHINDYKNCRISTCLSSHLGSLTFHVYWCPCWSTVLHKIMKWDSRFQLLFAHRATLRCPGLPVSSNLACSNLASLCSGNWFTEWSGMERNCYLKQETVVEQFCNLWWPRSALRCRVCSGSAVLPHLPQSSRSGSAVFRDVNPILVPIQSSHSGHVITFLPLDNRFYYLCFHILATYDVYNTLDLVQPLRI